MFEILGVIGVSGLLVVLNYGFQNHKWNNGIYKKTNKPWELFSSDCDIRYYRSYCMDYGYYSSYSCSISYSSIDNH